MNIRKGNHSVYGLQYHIILVTKYRRPCINDEIKNFLIDELTAVIKKREGTVVEINTDRDHVHILAELSPKYAISEVMACLKGASSRKVKNKFKNELSRFYYGTNYSFWSDSYFITTTGGATLDIVKKYIEDQGKTKGKAGRPKKCSK